jgi:hypothetical protein
MWNKAVIATAAALAFGVVGAGPVSAASVRHSARLHASEYYHPRIGLSRAAFGSEWGYPGYAYAAYGPGYACPGSGYAAAAPVSVGVASASVSDRAGGEG